MKAGDRIKVRWAFVEHELVLEQHAVYERVLEARFPLVPITLRLYLEGWIATLAIPTGFLPDVLAVRWLSREGDSPDEALGALAKVLGDLRHFTESVTNLSVVKETPP